MSDATLRQRILPALLAALALAACAAAPRPSISPSPTPAVDASSTAPVTPVVTPAAAAPGTPSPLVDPADWPSAWAGRLPAGALARLGIGHFNLVSTSLDGRFAAAGTSTGLLAFDAADAHLLWAAPTSLPVTGIEWSADGSRVTAYASQFSSSLYSAGLIQPGQDGAGQLPAQSLRIGLAGADRSLLGVLDPASGALIRPILTGSDAGDSLAWSPDGARLAVGTLESSAPNQVVIWDTRTARPDRALAPADPGSPMQAGWSSGGKLLAIGYDNHVHLFDTSSWAEVDSPPTAGGFTGIESVSTFAWAPDGDRIAVGGKDVWSVSQNRALYPITGADLVPVWSGDGRILVTSGGTGEMVAWDGLTGQKLRTLAESGPYVVSMALNPDGSLLAETSFGYRSDPCGRVNIWSIAAGKIIRSITTRDLPPYGCPRQIAWSPDGRTLAVAFTDKSTGGIVLFDAPSGVELKELRGHNSFISALAFSPDSARLASSSGDGTVILWDTGR